MKRIPILYLIFAVLVTVSVGPLLFYGIKVIALNRETLETNEKELQNTIARSVAEGIDLYQSSVQQQLQTLARTLTASWGNNTIKPANGKNANPNLAPGFIAWNPVELGKEMEEFVASNPNLLYVTLLNQQARGVKAGNYNADSDPFLRKMLERAFTAAQQNQPLQSEPVLVRRGAHHVPVMVMSLPLYADSQFGGLLAVVVALQPMVDRLQEYSIRGLEAFAVNDAGRLMLHPAPAQHSIGEDLSGLAIVRQFMDWPKGQARARATSSYDTWRGRERIPMVGTYCSVPGLGWAVIAQKPQSFAYISVSQMVTQTTIYGALVIFISLLVAYISARRITTPIEILTESSRAIARGDFTRRIQLQSRTEIGELANTFNQMTGELEQYVDRLKHAAQENHDLFLSSIRMIANAVDEKDPYTHGHSERVTRYAMLIAGEMDFSEEEIYRVKIAGLLHDVGKIGIEDRVLKKPGALTPEEFEIMKTHTTKGANILRPIEKLQEMIPGVELHHESLDGRGYPHGYKGEEIPMLARIISVADTFDAMTTERPYQAAQEYEEALVYIQSQAGKKYDPRCVDGLRRALESGKIRAHRSVVVV